MAEHAGGPVEVVYHPGDPQSSPLDVRSGTEVVITLHGSPSYGWNPIEVVAGRLAVIESEAAEGTATATVRATGPGDAELRSTSSFRGDRFGPQTRLWRLVVRVKP
jgi:hypothetical protein